MNPPQESTPHLTTSTTDDPRVVDQQRVEEYTNHVVPLSARSSRMEVLGGWSSIASAMAFLFYGVLAASLVGVQQAIIGLVLVTIIYSVLGRFLVKDSILLGLNSTLLCRRLFGSKGAAIAPLLVGLVAVYYAIFEGSVLAVALQTYFDFWDIRVWYAVVILGTLPLMLGGMQTWLAKLNGVSLPVYFFGVVAAVLVGAWQADWETTGASAFPDGATGPIPGWLTVFVLYMGIFILLPESQDTARFAKPEDLAFHQNVTFGWVFYTVTYLFNGLAGIAIIAFVGSGGGISEGGVVQGIIETLGVIGLLVIVVSQIRINSANFYFASVNLERFVAYFTPRGISRRAWVLLIGVAVFVLMLTDVFSYITTALAWQAVLLVTLVGIMVTDRLWKRSTDPEFRSSRLTSFTAGSAVWLVSSATGIALLELSDQLPRLSALAPLVALIVSVVLYVAVIVTGLDVRGHVVGRDPIREQVSDPWSTYVECRVCELAYIAQEMDVDTDGRPTCLSCQETPASR